MDQDQIELGAMALAKVDSLDWGHIPSDMKEAYRKRSQLCQAAGKGPWECAARRQGTAGGNLPADCDWPVCGCDPQAQKVINALVESGKL